MKYLFTLVVAGLMAFLFSCNDEKSKYSFDRYFTQQERDTLLVDLVTLIGKKPQSTDYATRLQPEYRTYYKQIAKEFSMVLFHQAGDTCYYYMIRPARSTSGSNRGVGGKLTLDSKGKIAYFEESFNTPIHPCEDLEKIGLRLFTELIEKKSIEGLRWNVDYIEWPDDRLKYDKEKREWRYDVTEQLLEPPVDLQ